MDKLQKDGDEAISNLYKLTTEKFESFSGILSLMNNEIIEVKELLLQHINYPYYPPPELKFIGVTEAANLLDMKTNGIYRLVKSGAIPIHKKPGAKQMFFTVSELLEWKDVKETKIPIRKK